MSGSPSQNQPSAKRINNAGWPSITCSDLDEMVFTILLQGEEQISRNAAAEATGNGAPSDHFPLRR